MKIDPEDTRPGDRITVRGQITGSPDAYGAWPVEFDGYDDPYFLTQDVMERAEITRPLRVGDTVGHPDFSDCFGEIIRIDGDQGTVIWIGGAAAGTWGILPMANLALQDREDTPSPFPRGCYVRDRHTGRIGRVVAWQTEGHGFVPNIIYRHRVGVRWASSLEREVEYIDRADDRLELIDRTKQEHRP